jgi:hypothetical protein
MIAAGQIMAFTSQNEYDRQWERYNQDKQNKEYYIEQTRDLKEKRDRMLLIRNIGIPVVSAGAAGFIITFFF